jgi:hypothetical protein
MFNQQMPIDQEGPPGLVAAEAMQQLDRLPTPQPEQALDHRTNRRLARRTTPASR